MNEERRPSITRWTRLLALALAAPLLVIELISGWVGYRQQVASAEVGLIESAGVVSGSIAEFLAAQVVLLESLVGRHGSQDRALCSSIRTLEAFDPHIVSVVLQQVDRSFACSTPIDFPGSVAPSSMAEHPWVLEAIDTGEPVWSPPYLGGVTNQWMVIRVVPLKDEHGVVWGTVGMGISLQRVQELVVQSSSPGVLVSVTTTDGVVVARSEEPERWIGEPVPGAAVSFEPDVSADFRSAETLDGSQRLFGYMPVDGVPWVVYAGVPEETVYSPARTFFTLQVGLGLLAIFIVLASGQRLEHAVVTSLRLLGERLSRANIHGEVVEVPDAAPAEIAEFVGQYNDVLTERSLALEREARARELVRSDDLRRRFLSVMSHELRTPLNAVLGAAEALDEGVYGAVSEEQRSGIGLITEGGRDLLHLIDDILDFISLGSEPSHRMNPVDTRGFCDTLVADVMPAANRKGVAFLFQSQVESSTFRVDERLMRKAIGHVLNNAVKFTPEGGEAGLTVAEDGDSIHFEVWDTGIGIPSEKVSEVFGPFTQLDSSLAREYPGTGIGLAITKGVTELYGGVLDVRERPGGGTVIRITLPLADD